MALLAKYADLFNKGASGYTTFAPLAVTAGGAPERYASSPLFCAGVTEPADAFVLRLLVLAYGWPQAFAPLIAFSAEKNMTAAMQPVTSMATNAPYMKMVRFNTRPVAAGTNLVGWDVLLQHADRHVLQKYAEGPQLAAEAPAVLAMAGAAPLPEVAGGAQGPPLSAWLHQRVVSWSLRFHAPRRQRRTAAADGDAGPV